MLRVELRVAGLPMVVLGAGDVLVFGRAPQSNQPEGDPGSMLQVTLLALPQSTPYTSRVLGELVVGEGTVRLLWHGATEARLASLFEAPGGARRVTLVQGMSPLLDEGENTITVLRGRLGQLPDQFDDLTLELTVTATEMQSSYLVPDDDGVDLTMPAPQLAHGSKEWFVALALAEPWLLGDDSYPRPPSNREIYERILDWHGYAWNLDRPQRVDDAIRAISRIAFGPRDDPFSEVSGRRISNVRFAIGRRAAEVRLVTAEDLAEVYARARRPD